MAAPRIQLEPYDPAWPVWYDRIAAIVGVALTPIAARIEHVGSTAVRGLTAKPIIDIDVLLHASADLDDAVGRLAVLGYRHQGDRGIPDRHAFDRVDGQVPHHGAETAWPDHHLYVCTHGCREFDRHIAFRDALRDDEDLAREYAELKQALAARFTSDRAAYERGKTEFVEKLLERLGSQD